MNYSSSRVSIHPLSQRRLWSSMLLLKIITIQSSLLNARKRV